MELQLTEQQHAAAQKLDAFQLKFANLLLQGDMIPPECYVAAGYTAANSNVASVCASRLASLPRVVNYLRSMRSTSMERVGLTLEYLDSQLTELMQGDLSEIIGTHTEMITKVVKDVDGNIVDVQVTEKHTPVLKCRIEDLPPHVTRCIQSIKSTANGVEVKMYSRADAVQLGMRRLGALLDKKELTGSGGALLQAMVEYTLVGGPGKEPPVDATE